jgi:hypothetical protein
MPTMLTADQLEERPEGTFYTGPIEPAKTHLAHDYASAVSEKDGVTTVLLGYTADTVTWENCSEFGKGQSPEEAWRYALGAAYGPVDDEFQPIDLDARPAPVPS